MDERPNAARMYDWFLGGAHNLAADREAGQALLASYPGIVGSARANRDFLARTVRWCLRRGIDQFLDLGSGVPTVGNVHEVVARAGVDGRVAYVEVEAVAVAVSREVLAPEPRATITHADLRHVETVLAAPGVAGHLDFGRPVALLAVAVLHFLDAADAAADVLARYRRMLAPGSVVVVSHNSDDHDDPAMARAMSVTVNEMSGTASPVHVRDRTELLALMDGLDIVEPGLVPVHEWRPEPTISPAPPSPVYGVVGVVPG